MFWEMLRLSRQPGRMRRFVDRLQLLNSDVGVDFCGIEAGMAKHCL